MKHSNQTRSRLFSSQRSLPTSVVFELESLLPFGDNHLPL